MARNTVRRFIQIIFERLSAKKAESEMASSLGAAGKKGGENFLRELRAAFDKRMASLKVSFAKGLIDAAQFKKQGDLAARDFNAGVIKGMESARAAGKLTDSEYLKLSRTLKRVGDDGTVAGGRTASAFMKAGTAIAGFLAARFGIQQFARFLAESVHQAIEAEDSVARLDSVLQPLGISYHEVADEVERTLDRIQKTTRFSDGDAREALVNLVTATGDYGLSLKLLDVAAKIAEKRHTTMAEASQTAADASRGLTKGMKDLGISAKDSGDIVEKINRNLGNLAEEGAKKGSGAVAQMNNLWKEFQEKIGAAILGSDGLKDSIGPNGLLGALIALNEWAEKNSKAISGFVDKLVWVGKGVARVSQEILRVIPNPLMIAKGIDLIRGKVKGLFDDVVAGSSTAIAAAKRGRELTQEELEALEEKERLQKAAAKEALHRTEQLKKQFKENKADVEQEIADLRRLAAAQGEGANAVEVLSRALRTEADIRKTVKDLGPEEAAQLGTLIRLRDEERQKVDALGRSLSQSLDLAVEIADLRRLAVAYGQGAEAVEALQTQLAFEADLRRALVGVTSDQADEIAALLELRRKEREEAEKVRKRTSQEEFLRDLAKETDLTRRLAAAQMEGPAAVRALNRELFIQQKIMEAGTKITEDMIAKIRELAGAQFDAANKTKSAWENAFDTIGATVVDSLSGIGQAWVDRADTKERRQEIVKALKDENLSVERRIELEKELGELGTPWLIKFAKAKVKENLAAALEMAAKALGMLVFGNVPGATQAAASAAGHTAAALAWRAIGGGGGSSSSSTASVGGGAAAGVGRSGSMEQQTPETHIHFKGSSFFLPEVQKQIYASQLEARQKYGQNAKIIVHRDN